MSGSLIVNGRFRTRNANLTGVERYAQAVSLRLNRPHRILQPGDSRYPFSGHVWEQLSLPRYLSADDWLWSPANIGPIGVHRQILTVHDVAVLDHPEWFAPAFRLVYRLFWPELLPRVAQIITVSEFSRSRILAHFPALATPIDVVQNGVDTDFFSRLLGEYTAPRQPYCLTVGSLQPRKNLRTLISYWQENAAELPRLVVVGSPARSFARQPGFAKHEKIDYVGRISDRRLLDYYRGARALLLTSHYEGSSLPGLEAMAAGCPVLASDIEAHREVLGAAAGYFPAHDLSGLAEHIRKLNPSEPGRAVQIDAGSIRSRSFSWERTAQHTSAVIQRAIDA